MLTKTPRSQDDYLMDTRALGLGGFLIGLGWYAFPLFTISSEIFAWILILAGAGIIVSALISSRSPNLPAKRLSTGLLGGLILSLILTSGLGLLRDIDRGTPWTYRAEAAKTYSGTVTTERVYFEVNNINGLVRVSTWDKTEYKIDLRVRAGGSSQKNAEDNLAAFRSCLDERLDQGQKRLILAYDLPLSASSRYSLDVETVLPSSSKVTLDLESSNGGIYLTGIRGDALSIATSNGPLVFDSVRAETLTGRTSNGRIEGKAEAKNVVLATSNGRIELRIPRTISGKYDLRANNGAIELRVSPQPQVGYNLDLSTSNANVNINLPNLDYGLNQRTEKRAQTTGFGGKTIQITIRAATSNSNIDINTS